MSGRSSNPSQKLTLLMEQSSRVLEDPRHNKTRLKKVYTARELFEIKRSQISDNRADFRKKMRAAPREVRRVYHLWRRRVRRAYLNLVRKSGGVKVILYSDILSGSRKGPDCVYQVVRLLTHPAQGWDVKVSRYRVSNGVKTVVVLSVW